MTDFERLRRHVARSPNEDWRRPFEVEKEVSVDGGTAFLCRFTRPLPREGDPSLDRFGAVVLGGIVEVWPILTYRAEGPREVSDEDLARRALNELDRHKCPECGKYVKFRVRTRQMGPEAALVRYTCLECGASFEDVLD